MDIDMTGVAEKTAANEYTLCTECGFTRDVIEKRVRLMGLTDDDKPAIEFLLEKIIKPSAHAIIDEFYDYVLSHKPMYAFIKNEDALVRLKQTQLEYLTSFGKDFDTKDYFEYHLRIGIAHARIQLPMHLYLAAFSKMQVIIQNHIYRSGLTCDAEQQENCFNLITKIIMLDISIVIDSYTFMKMNHITEFMHELKSEKEKLANQLMHDSLTGILSRAYIIDSLKKKIAQVKRKPDVRECIALLDIDHFKRVNDQYGHPSGDLVLKQFCAIVQSEIRQQDYFGRYGGEEFLLILDDIGCDSALSLLERIRVRIEKYKFQLESKQVNITVSTGLTEVTGDDNIEELIDKTDKALYAAKKAGRNRIVKS